MIYVYVLLAVFLLPKLLGGGGLGGILGGTTTHPSSSPAVNPANSLFAAFGSIAGAFSTPPTASPAGTQNLDSTVQDFQLAGGVSDISTVNDFQLAQTNAPLSTTLVAPPGATDPLASSQGSTFDQLSSTIGF
jgi:hypothetical protein